MTNERKVRQLGRQAAEQCLGFSVRRAARAVSRHYDEAFAPLGIKGTQFSLMNAAYLMNGASIGSLAEVLVMERTTLTRNLRPLQQSGLIDIQPGADRRNRSIKLTAEGIRLLHKALAIWADTHARLVQQLGSPTASRLARDLGKLTALTRDG